MIIRILAVLCALQLGCLAAIPGTTQWDVRTTGNDANGGGFDPGPGTGTDWSQQNLPQVTINNSTIIATATTTVVTFTSNSYTVLAGDVNNAFHLVSGVSGCTAGWYIITSVSAGLNGTWTVDRDTTCAGAAITSGFMGGSLATVVTAVNTVGISSQEHGQCENGHLYINRHLDYLASRHFRESSWLRDGAWRPGDQATDYYSD